MSDFIGTFWFWFLLVVSLAAIWGFLSCAIIGPSQIGLVLKRLGAKLPDDNPIAFNGEAGYQWELLLPGLRFRPWPIFSISKRDWVQIPPNQIGLVISQVGKPLPVGAKSAVYKPQFGGFTDVKAFLENGGEKGVQRPVLPPGTMAPIHPVAFLVLTKDRTFGQPMSEDTEQLIGEINAGELVVTRIDPEPDQDVCGVVTVLEGAPAEPGDIASRLGGFADIDALAKQTKGDTELIDGLLNSSNQRHNNYQDFQAFLDAGGRIGLQHDPLGYGAFNLNPLLVRVERVPMLVVEQGEVAVVKAYVGLPTADTSGASYKYGFMVRPGRRGLWQEPLRTGKYAINPRLYEAIRVPTQILTLNWANYSSTAHELDKDLKPIDAKSKEGFDFAIDLQVQLHVPDTMAPRVICRVGSMENLVRELLQGAVGNHFRNKLQGMGAVEFISERAKVQAEAEDHVRALLGQYEVDTIGVFIQDVKLPAELTTVLKAREIAKQEVETNQRRKDAEVARKEVEAARGLANKQAELVGAEVNVQIATHNAAAAKAKAEGDATYTQQTGLAEAQVVEAKGVALAAGYKAQVDALGAEGTTRVNVARELAGGKHAFVPTVSAGSGASMVEALIGFTALNSLPKPSSPAPVTSSAEANAGAAIATVETPVPPKA